MKKHNISFVLIIIASLLLFASCELKRSNPVDPTNHDDIQTPPTVTGLIASGSGPGIQNKYVELKWNRNNIYTDGYYIYRGMAYNSAFAVVDTVGNPEGQMISRVIPVIASGHYYFKVSAFKQYPAGRLEGSLSEYKYAYVSN